MDDRLQSIEQKVDQLSELVDRLQRRLVVLEAERAPVFAPAEPAATTPAQALAVAQEALVAPPGSAMASASPPEVVALPTGADVGRFVALSGRSLLVFGGAFFFRAMTERDSLPRSAGVALGLAFAALWVALAWRDARGRDAWSARFHGVTAALIGFPLVSEATLRLGVLSTPTAAVTLAAFAGLLLFTAWRHDLALVGWAGVLGALGTAVALWSGAADPWPVALLLVVLGCTVLALDASRGWTGVRWLPMLVANFLLLRWVSSLAAQPDEAHAGQLRLAVAFAFALVLVSLATIAARTWRWRLPLGAFEAVQTVAVLTLGVATALRVQGLLPGVALGTGAAALVLAGGALDSGRRLVSAQARGFDVWFYSVLGLVLVLAGGPLASRGVFLTLLWAGLGFTAAVLGRRGHPLMLWGFAALLGWAAAGAGDVLVAVRDGWVAGAATAWAPFGGEVALATALIVGSYLAQTVRRPGPEAGPSRLLAGALLLLVVATGAASVMALARALLGGEGANVGALELSRTLVIVAAALGLSVARRWGGPAELGWAAWVVLAASGLKLLVQDLRLGQAGTLFVAFIAVGAGVLLVPRLMRRPGATPVPVAAGSSASDLRPAA